VQQKARELDNEVGGESKHHEEQAMLTLQYLPALYKMSKANRSKHCEGYERKAVSKERIFPTPSLELSSSIQKLSRRNHPIDLLRFYLHFSSHTCLQ